eukprot:tig00021366_g20844.t1
MILLCSDGLLGDSRVLLHASGCSDAGEAPVRIPFRSSLVSAAEVAFSHPSPAAAALAPRAFGNPRAAASALCFLAELILFADYLDVPRLERACGSLACGASDQALQLPWARASLCRRCTPRKRTLYEATDHRIAMQSRRK